MKAQDLKNSIFQLAIKGKLVPQNPEDEPASVLLEKIRTGKEKLIKSKKIKRNKKESLIYRENSSYYEKMGNEIKCIDDKIPFEIPESWEWARLGMVCNYGSCNSIDSDDIDDDDWLLDLKDIEKNTGKILVFTTKKDIKSKSKKHVFTKGEVLYSKLRPYLNKVVIAESDGFCTSEILPLNFGENIFNKYAQILLMSPYFINYAKNCSYGVKMPRLGTKDGVNALFPLPPLEEQKRIVKKIEELLPYVKEYGEAEEKLEELNETFPEKIKASILQEAVQGELVPQNHDDVPAKELLAQIQKEKEQLIKDKKIKKNSKESVIFRDNGHFYEKIGKKGEPVCIDEEIPFEIPESWVWCRLGDILTKLTDGAHTTPKYTDSGIPFLSVKDMSSGKLNFSNTKFISKEEHNALYKRCNPEKNDVLLTKVGTTGIPVLVDTDKEFSLFVSVALLKFNHNLIYNKYLITLINSPLVRKQCIKNTKGVGNKNWVLRDINKSLIVLPPLEEQKRIVAKIERLFEICKEFDKDLSITDIKGPSIFDIDSKTENKIVSKPGTLDSFNEPLEDKTGK